jgi:hypothetical protein
MINGILHQKELKTSVFIIELFSEELKQKIRTQLSIICHGTSDGESSRISYNYVNTLKEFFERYKHKTSLQKKGMIGELLSHILVLSYFEDFDTVSPYFNSEERNVKKGFDVVLHNSNDSEIWITEVKSGHIHKDKNANETTNDLLGTAKRDLNTRLNENNLAIWKNAIVGAKNSLDNYSDKKKLVKDILESIQDSVALENAVSVDKNVMLVSNLFHTLTDKVTLSTADNFLKSLEKEKIFNDHMIVCIQKETVDKIESFLKSELTNG